MCWKCPTPKNFWAPRFFSKNSKVTQKFFCFSFVFVTSENTAYYTKCCYVTSGIHYFDVWFNPVAEKASLVKKFTAFENAYISSTDNVMFHKNSYYKSFTHFLTQTYTRVTAQGEPPPQAYTSLITPRPLHSQAQSKVYLALGIFSVWWEMIRDGPGMWLFWKQLTDSNFQGMRPC